MKYKHKIELLAPGGDIESIKAAILAGADAIYCGLDQFNARNRATNISFEELLSILRVAHSYNCKIFLTFNIILLEHEIPRAVNLLNRLVNTDLDGIIIQDLGLFYILKKYFPTLEVHVSTQATTHNEGQILFLNRFNVDRVNLSRELSLKEITHLTKVSHKNNISTEIFVHGSNCICFSGICYMSSVNGGNSGNRGRCSQPCRAKYKTTSVGVDHPLNIKDNSAFLDLEEIYKTSVDSIKVEGRIKKYHYVYTVIDSWRKQLERFYNNKNLIDNRDSLYKVFNRDFSDHFLKGKITKDIFIDSPRNYSLDYFIKKSNLSDENRIEEMKNKLFNEKQSLDEIIKEKVDSLIIEKLDSDIKKRKKVPFVDIKRIEEEKYNNKGKKYNNKGEKENHQGEKENNKGEHEKQKGEHKVTPLQENQKGEHKVTPLQENNKGEYEVTPLQENHQGEHKVTPLLSILISSEKDLEFCDNSHEIFFQLPDSLDGKYNYFITLFKNNRYLIPYFSSILIGDDYSLATKFLDELNPKLIVTNNTGIAFYAYKKDISWIAGPFLNITNSYSLISLKDNFNCYGAFISNEINKNQIKKISNPKGLKLYYSIYHKILVMTTRECLFHQVTGCEKTIVDNNCIKLCNRSSTITRSNGSKYFINKREGDNHRIFNDIDFLNLDIVKDIPNKFSSFLIDLRDIETKTQVTDKKRLITLFETVLNSNSESESESEKEIKENILYYTNNQYKKGL